MMILLAELLAAGYLIMASFERIFLSGSQNGKPINIGATGSPGTLIHQTITAITSQDEVYLWVSNTSGNAANLTVEWGGVNDPDDLLCKSTSIGANSAPAVVISGATINSALSIRAYSNTANSLNILGYVNRISQ